MFIAFLSAIKIAIAVIKANIQHFILPGVKSACFKNSDDSVEFVSLTSNNIQGVTIVP